MRPVFRWAELVVFSLALGPLAVAIAVGAAPSDNQVSADVAGQPPVVAPATGAASSPEASWQVNARVIRIVDGDTIVAGYGGRETSVRLLEVDAPELQDAHGPESRAALHNLLAGESVTLSSEGPEGKDAYGRVLAYVQRAPDGLFVNEELVRQGYARVYKTVGAPNQAAFTQLEARARAAKKGMWGDPPPPLAQEPSYWLLRDGQLDTVLTFRPDQSFVTEKKAIPQYRWEVADGGLVLTFFSARYLLQPTTHGCYSGTYTGPDKERIGERLDLLPICGAGLPQNTGGTVTAEPPPPPAPAADIVYVTRTGEKYHRAGCRYLSKSRIPMARDEAIRRGYTPCSVCRP